MKKSLGFKKRIIGLLLLVLTTCSFMGCTQAERVSRNLSTEADSFNIIRQVTVIDCITGDTLFQISGKISITADSTDNQLEIISEENGNYKKHFVGLSNNVSYVVEQLDVKNVDNYKFTINYNPKMWIPVGLDNID